MPHILEPYSSPLSSLCSPDLRAQRIRVKNRRKLYLDRHPSYFTSPDLELADPLLYDRCIRRFQSAAEREADGKAKGYSGVLEADLYRSEAKLTALASSYAPNSTQHTSSSDPQPLLSNPHSPSSSHGQPSSLSHGQPSPFTLNSRHARTIEPSPSYIRGSDGGVLPEEEDEIPASKEDGIERWKYGMTIRFLRGDDEDFNYGEVDEDEQWDEVERREEEEVWFEDEEPEWVGEEGKGGETGIQDF